MHKLKRTGLTTRPIWEKQFDLRGFRTAREVWDWLAYQCQFRSEYTNENGDVLVSLGDSDISTYNRWGLCSLLDAATTRGMDKCPAEAVLKEIIVAVHRPDSYLAPCDRQGADFRYDFCLRQIAKIDAGMDNLQPVLNQAK